MPIQFCLLVSLVPGLEQEDILCLLFLFKAGERSWPTVQINNKDVNLRDGIVDPFVIWEKRLRSRVSCSKDGQLCYLVPGL